MLLDHMQAADQVIARGHGLAIFCEGLVLLFGVLAGVLIQGGGDQEVILCKRDRFRF